MSDPDELTCIINDIDVLKDIEKLSFTEQNKLMLIAGRLTGIIRVFYHNTERHDIALFIEKSDTMLLESNKGDIGKVFYIIAVSVEILQKLHYNRESKHKRSRNRKRSSKSGYSQDLESGHSQDLEPGQETPQETLKESPRESLHQSPRESPQEEKYSQEPRVEYAEF